MRHQRSTKKLGRTASHRKAMLRNLVTSLFREERVVTTHSRARVARSVAERFITRAREGGLANRRLVARDIRDEAALRKLFNELGPRFADRPGGYTRILKLGQREGDGAHTSILELLGAPAIKEREDKEPKKGKRGRRAQEAEEKEKGEEKDKAEAKGDKGKDEKSEETRVKAEKRAATKEKRAEEKAARKAARAIEKASTQREGGAKPKKDEKGGAAKSGRRRLGFGRKSS